MVLRSQPSLIALVLAALGGGVFAQAPDPLLPELIAVRARVVETVADGTLTDAVIVIRGGKVEAVGPADEVRVPLDATVIEADTVLPGLVGVYSQIGLSSAGTQAAQNAHLRVMDELYPYADAYARLLRAGVTTLALVPTGRGIGGQGAVIRPLPAPPAEVALRENAPLGVNFQATTQVQNLLRNAFDGAPADPPPAAGEAQQEQPGVAQARRAALARAVSGAAPTFIACSDAGEAAHALRLFERYEELEPVYVLGSDAYLLAEELGERKAAVVLAADLTFEPRSRNRMNVPAMLAEAGARVALRPPTDNPAGYEGLLFKLGELIKAGLDRETALRAVTLLPAELLGLEERVGGIAAGRDGNLLLLSGDPFSAVTHVTHVVLEGRVVYEAGKD